VRQGIRDANVIRWCDSAGPAPPRPVAEFLARSGSEARTALALDRNAAPVVALERSAREEAWRDLATSRLERGGLLIGEPFAAGSDDARIALVHVRAAVPGADATASGISLRMEASVWSAARERLGPGEVVVGWYHSHPGIGAFFSDTDRRTQAGFFNHPFSLGWVIDPFRDEEAWFVGAGAAPVDASRVVAIETGRA
jgi:proteasome lid subunit RPN8/RPN11